MVKATLELDGMEITTTDGPIVRMMWSMLSGAIRPDDAAVLGLGNERIPPRAPDKAR